MEKYINFFQCLKLVMVPSIGLVKVTLKYGPKIVETADINWYQNKNQCKLLLTLLFIVVLLLLLQLSLSFLLLLLLLLSLSLFFIDKLSKIIAIKSISKQINRKFIH